MNSKEITDLLVAWSQGDRGALTPLMDQVHARLIRLAKMYLKNERGSHTLDAAGLVNEAYLRLVRQEHVGWQGRAHFFAMTAKLMRRVLLDHARRRDAVKRGRDALVIPLQQVDDDGLVGVERHPRLIALDDALRALEAHDGSLAELVVLRYFGGMRKEEVGEVLGISSATVSRRWRVARAWLHAYLASPTTPDARAS